MVYVLATGVFFPESNKHPWIFGTCISCSLSSSLWPPGIFVKIWSIHSNDYASKTRIKIMCDKSCWIAPYVFVAQSDFLGNSWDDRTLARMPTWRIIKNPVESHREASRYRTLRILKPNRESSRIIPNTCEQHVSMQVRYRSTCLNPIQYGSRWVTISNTNPYTPIQFKINMNPCTSIKINIDQYKSRRFLLPTPHPIACYWACWLIAAKCELLICDGE